MSGRARFDDHLLRPPKPGAASDDALSRRLFEWCHQGALPSLTLPFDAAVTARHPGLDAAAEQLDGSTRLRGLKRWQGLIWRLQVRLADLAAWRDARADDPWDCGWLREPLDLPRLRAWRPRRPSLLLCETPDALPPLREQADSYRKPVRLLIVTSAALPGLKRL